MLRRHHQRGDTLIEVLFAFTIFSMVVVGAMSIMNQGTVASQRALETTLVRSEIDAQATTIRFLHDAYVAKFQPNSTYDPATPAGQWVEMTSGLTSAGATATTALTECPAFPNRSFILDAVNAKYVARTTANIIPATTFAQVSYDPTTNVLTNSQGIWIEGVRSVATGDANKDTARYIDFHIRACWESPGRGAPMTLGTIVRLYEPRS